MLYCPSLYGPAYRAPILDGPPLDVFFDELRVAHTHGGGHWSNAWLVIGPLVKVNHPFVDGQPSRLAPHMGAISRDISYMGDHAKGPNLHFVWELHFSLSENERQSSILTGASCVAVYYPPSPANDPHAKGMGEFFVLEPRR